MINNSKTGPTKTRYNFSETQDHVRERNSFREFWRLVQRRIHFTDMNMNRTKSLNNSPSLLYTLLLNIQ